jgi:iron-sulfur cluster insertion protein
MFRGHEFEETRAMSEVVAPAEGAVELSDQAARKVSQLLAQRGDQSLMLRVYIEGGGCSGFQYGFTFDAEPGEGDMVVENGGVRMLVDPMSFQYLQGSRVDYREDLQGARFTIDNPNAATTCGCGSSFGI